jgi:hypothetical protein
MMLRLPVMPGLPPKGPALLFMTLWPAPWPWATAART